jgi:hypothetical protein
MDNLIVDDESMSQDAHDLVAEIAELDRKIKTLRNECNKAKEELKTELGLPIKGDKVRLLTVPPDWKKVQEPREILAFVQWVGTSSTTLPRYIFNKVKKDGTKSSHRLNIWDDYKIVEIINT